MSHAGAALEVSFFRCLSLFPARQRRQRSEAACERVDLDTEDKEKERAGKCRVMDGAMRVGRRGSQGRAVPFE